MKHLTKLLSGAIIGFGLILQSAGVSAADVKMYSGNMCKAYYPSEESQLAYFTWGMYNYGPGMYVTCPMVRDDYNNLNGRFVNVWVGTANPVTCWHDEMNPDGSLVQRVSQTRAVNGFMGGLATTASASTAPHLVWCYLPQGSFITTVLTTEFAATDGE